MKRFKLLKEKFASEYLKEKNRLDAKTHKQRNDLENQQMLQKRNSSASPKKTHRDPLADQMMNLSMNQSQADQPMNLSMLQPQASQPS